MASSLLENLTLGVPLATDIFYFVGAPGTVPVDRKGTFSNFVFFNGALGTPISGTLTNCTGLPIAGITGLGTGVATLLAATPSGTGGLAGTTSPTFTTSVNLPNTINQVNSGTLTFLLISGQNVAFSLGGGAGFYIQNGPLLLTDSGTQLQRSASGKIAIVANMLGIGVGTPTATYGFQLQSTSGLPANQTMLVQDATPSTGITGIFFNAGAAQSTNPILTVAGILKATIFLSDGTVRFKGYTVATLPAGVVGDNAYVTDALAPTFLATVVGGGAIVTPVFYNGSAWVGA